MCISCLKQVRSRTPDEIEPLSVTTSESNDNTEAFELVTKDVENIEDSTTPIDDNYHTESYHLEDLFDGKTVHTQDQTNKQT